MRTGEMDTGDLFFAPARGDLRTRPVVPRVADAGSCLPCRRCRLHARRPQRRHPRYLGVLKAVRSQRQARRCLLSFAPAPAWRSAGTNSTARTAVRMQRRPMCRARAADEMRRGPAEARYRIPPVALVAAGDAIGGSSCWPPPCPPDHDQPLTNLRRQKARWVHERLALGEAPRDEAFRCRRRRVRPLAGPRTAPAGRRGVRSTSWSSNSVTSWPRPH